MFEARHVLLLCHLLFIFMTKSLYNGFKVFNKHQNKYENKHWMLIFGCCEYPWHLLPLQQQQQQQLTLSSCRLVTLKDCSCNMRSSSYSLSNFSWSNKHTFKIIHFDDTHSITLMFCRYRYLIKFLMLILKKSSHSVNYTINHQIFLLFVFDNNESIFHWRDGHLATLFQNLRVQSSSKIYEYMYLRSY